MKGICDTCKSRAVIIKYLCEKDIGSTGKEDPRVKESFINCLQCKHLEFPPKGKVKDKLSRLYPDYMAKDMYEMVVA